MRIVRYDWPTQQWGPKCEISDLAGGPSGGRGFVVNCPVVSLDVNVSG